jgi:predicted RNase H-like nuclease (RuvC/YqgF family)
LHLPTTEIPSKGHRKERGKTLVEAIRRLEFGMDLEEKDGMDLEENALPVEEQDTGHVVSEASDAITCAVKDQEARILELTSTVQRLKRRVRCLEGTTTVEEIVEEIVDRHQEEENRRLLGYRIADLVGFKLICELQQSTWQEWTPLKQK